MTNSIIAKEFNPFVCAAIGLCPGIGLWSSSTDIFVCTRRIIRCEKIGQTDDRYSISTAYDQQRERERRPPKRTTTHMVLSTENPNALVGFPVCSFAGAICIRATARPSDRSSDLPAKLRYSIMSNDPFPPLEKSP